MVSNSHVNLTRSSTTSCLIIDYQSAKHVDRAQGKGYGEAKRVSGIKRHLTVDTEDFPCANAVTTADISDREGAMQMFSTEPKVHWKTVREVMYDGGYRGSVFAQQVVEAIKRRKGGKFEVLAKHWIIDPSFG